MPEIREQASREDPKNSQELKIDKRVRIPFLKLEGVITAVVAGPKRGDPKIYEVLLDKPLTLGKNDYEHRFRADQLELLGSEK